MKKLIILLCMSTFALTSNAQSYESSSSNWSCLQDIMNSGCTTVHKSKTIFNSPLNCIATGCTPTGASPKITIDWTEITCNGKKIIIGGGYRIDYTACCAAGIPITISGFDIEKTNSIYWTLLAQETGMSSGILGTQMFLAKASTCWSTVIYTVNNPGCTKTVGEGPLATTVGSPSGIYTNFARIPCSGGGCCVGLATIDPNTDGITNIEIVNNTSGNCGDPDITRYIGAYVANDYCPLATYTINSFTPCIADVDCNFDLSGTYNPHDNLLKSTGFTMNNQQYQFINIYPVPVNDFLYIKYDKELSKPMIVDLQGKEVMKVNAEDKKIDVSKLSKGTYIYKAISADNKVISKQFIKQ